MKTNKHKSIRLFPALAAVLAAVSAFFAYAATVDELTAITGTAELMFTEENMQYRSGTLYVGNQFLIGESNHVKGEKGPFTFGSDSYWGAPMNNRQVYFKIAEGYTADVTIYVNIINTAKYIHLKDSDGNDVVKSTNAATGTEIITATGLAAGTYYVMGDNNDAMLCGIKVNAKPASTDPTYATITKDYTWRAENIQLKTGFNYESPKANEYYIDYTGDKALDAITGPIIDGKSGFGYKLEAPMKFKVGAGKGTLTIYTTSDWKRISLTHGDETLTADIKTEWSTDENGVGSNTDIYTFEFNNTQPEIFSLSYADQEAEAVIGGFSIKFDGEVTPPTPVAPDFATISGDFSWIATNGVDVVPGNNTPVMIDGAQKYYTYYNSDANAGVTAETDPKVLLHGGGSLAYILNGKKLGFKVAPGKYVIDFHVSTGAQVSLYTDDEAATGNDNTYKGTLATTSATVDGVSGDRVRTIVDKSSDTADQVYWVKVEGGSLAGFDVMFDISSASDISSVTALSASGEWTPTSTELPYATGLGTLGTYISGAGTNFYHLGQTVSLQSQYNNCVPLGDNRAIGFRLAAGNQNTISIATKGSGSFKVVSGTDPFNGAVEVTSSTVEGTNPHAFALPSDEETPLWIIGDATVNVEKVTYTIEQAASAGPLVDIKNYYLWRAGDETVDANKYFAANYLRHNTDGSAATLTPDESAKVRVLGVETPTVQLDNTNEIVLKLGAGTKGKVNVYYSGANTDLQIKTGGGEDGWWATYGDDNKVATAVTPSAGAATIEGTTVKSYVYDRTGRNSGYVRIENGKGTGVRIAAIEVVTDKNIAAIADKNIDWYVCGDTKMIAGSERVSGNTEYAEFYVSKGRKPRVSFFMPSVLKVFYEEKKGNPDGKYKVTINNGGSKKTLTMPKLYGSDGKMIDTSKGDIWQWMTQDVEVNPKADNTQTVRLEATDVDGDGNARTWNVELKFHFIDCPSISVKDNSTTATLTMTAAKGYETFPVFYTIDSTDPANLDNTTVVTDETEEYYSTMKYEGAVDVKVNCIALAAQYVTTEKPFYTDGPGSTTSSVFKLLSEQKYIMLADREDIIYVNDPSKGSAFAKTAGDIDVLEIGGSPVLRFMYGKGTGSVANAVKFFRTVDNDNTFQLGAVKWGGTKDDQDGGYDTYMDPYQFTLAGGEPAKVTVDNSEVKFNANPNTEMNGGIGGANTEDGGMFLQPVGGDFFRLEPEYDGVATVWVRQKGMVDYGNMYNGEISRRPVYVLDEDGVVQRGSTIKPTNLHHLAVNGVYATASGRNELRASFANAWKYATVYDEGWNILHNRIKRADSYFPMTYELMQIWFGDILKFTTTGTDNYVIKSGKPSAAPIAIDRTASANINRYSRIGTQLLYRDDWMYSQEQELQKKYPNATANPFAKYGYEIPNFGYVQYRIPVKAGKTYYMGGRGTKNGFVAMQFEPMPPNYDNKAYQRIDNPTVIDGRGASRATLDWPKKEPDVKLDYSATAAVAEYDDAAKVPTLTIDENDRNNQWWTSQDKNERPNMLSGMTINVDLKRNFKAGQWYPIVLPFSVSESRLQEMFGKDVKVLYLDPSENSFHGDTDRKFNSVYRPAIENTELKFTYHHYQMLYANTPAFICPSEITTDSKLVTTDGSGNTTFHFRRVCFRGGDIKTYEIGGGYEVTGSYVPTDGSANGEMYYISNEDGKVVMYHSRHGIDMKGTRCWIRPKGKTNAPIMTMGFGSFSADGFDDDSGTTGITDVISDEAPATLYDNDNVYDIMGRVVATGSTAGLPSGIYIFKGKKVYVK